MMIQKRMASSPNPLSKGEGSDRHYKSILHNYQLNFAMLFNIFKRYNSKRNLQKAKAACWWPSLLGKVGIAAMVLISSCKVGKEYKRPDLELPQQFNNVSFADT